MANITTIIFDLDGVIVNSEVVWTKADLLFLVKQGVIISNKEYQMTLKPQLMGLTISDGVKLMKDKYKFSGKVNQLIEERKHIITTLFEDVDFMPGFKNFYKKVHKQYKVAIATSLESLFLNQLSQRLKLSILFNQNIFSTEDIGLISKPDPLIFLYVAKKLKVDPKNCLVIEDSPNGV